MKRLILVSLMILTSGVARADFTKGSQTAALFGGVGGSNTQYDYESGDNESVTGAGGAFGGQYLYYVSESPAFAVGVDFSRSLNGDEQSDDLLAGYDSTQRLKSTIGLALVRLSYPKGTFRPYLFTGAGFHHSTQRLSARPQPGNTWTGGGAEDRTLIDEDKTSAALGVGIGLDIFPTESFFIGAELRGTWLVGLDTDDTPALRNAGFTVDDDEEGISQGNIFFRAGIKF